MSYDVIVIGAGVEGSATAYYSTNQGAKTLLLEQFPLPHSRGSSHGQTRIIRKAYDKLYYANMMEEAYQMWEQLERDTGTQLLIKTGLLNVGETKKGALKSVQDSLEQIASQYTYLIPSKLKADFPAFRFDRECSGIFDPEAGVLFADRACRALQEKFREGGGTLKDAEKVTLIQPGHTVSVTTNRGTYHGSSVIITAGPWANKLLAPLGIQLPLQARKIDVLYWKVPNDGYQAKSGFPTFHKTSGDQDTEANSIYGMPDLEYPGLMKICSHLGTDVDPDKRDGIECVNVVQHIATFIRHHLPGVATEPSIRESCIYTMTPDHDFILDSIPGYNNLIVAAGFSGHGFKLAPVIGKVLFELAKQRKLSYDLSPFKINRFRKIKISKL